MHACTPLLHSIDSVRKQLCTSSVKRMPTPDSNDTRSYKDFAVPALSARFTTRRGTFSTIVPLLQVLQMRVLHIHWQHITSLWHLQRWRLAAPSASSSSSSSSSSYRSSSRCCRSTADVQVAKVSAVISAVPAITRVSTGSTGGCCALLLLLSRPVHMQQSVQQRASNYQLVLLTAVFFSSYSTSHC